MAGFFSLGGRSGTTTPNQDNHTNPTNNPNSQPEIHPSESWFWYRNNNNNNNDDVCSSSYKPSLELWQQQHQQQQQLLVHRPQQDLFPVGLGINVASDESSRSGGFTTTTKVLGTSSGGMSCQDCGNQAKKDCSHMRCRTCCKSRGFECPTHVKSTWVPAAKRRERQQQLAALKHQQQQLQLRQQQLHNNPKRLREGEDPGNSSLVCTHITTGFELEDFPVEVSSPAVFRCVRVSPIDDADDAYAYQTAVNINGHIFKGILYDQGPETTFIAGGGNGRGSRDGGGTVDAVTAVEPLNLITAADTAVPAITTAESGDGISAQPPTTGTALFDPSSMYPAPFNSYMAGTQFFPHQRS